MRIFLVPNLNKSQARQVCGQAVSILRQAGAVPLLAEEIRADCLLEQAEYHPEQACFALCDAIVTIGGDGTILRTARESLAFARPLLGVNLGRLGFLATCEISEMASKLTRLAKGDFMTDTRMLLQASIRQPDQPPQTLTALNEIVVFKGLRTQTMGMKVFCDDALVSSYRGDGVVLATPTGSTAYSLSAGGPILDAQIAGILLTPICAHSLQSPPMVFSSNRRLRVQVESETDEPVYLSADGNHPAQAISPHSRLELARAEQVVTLVRFNLADQFEAIDKKLIRKITL